MKRAVHGVDTLARDWLAAASTHLLRIVVEMLAAIRKSVALKEGSARKGLIARSAREAFRMPLFGKRRNDAVRDALVAFTASRRRRRGERVNSKCWDKQKCTSGKTSPCSTFRNGAGPRTHKTWPSPKAPGNCHKQSS